MQCTQPPTVPHNNQNNLIILDFSYTSSIFAFRMKTHTLSELAPTTLQTLFTALLANPNLNLESIHGPSTSSNVLCPPIVALCCMCFPWLESSGMFFNCLHLLSSHSFFRSQIRSHFLQKSLDTWSKPGPADIGSQSTRSLLWITFAVCNCTFINGIICLIFVLLPSINYMFQKNLLLKTLFLLSFTISSLCI